MLCAKDLEQRQLLEEYQKLCDVAQEMGSQSEVLSEEASSARLEIMAKDLNVKQLLERNQEMEKSLEEVIKNL